MAVESQFPPDDQDPVVGLKRRRHMKAYSYVLKSGRIVRKDEYRGEHPTPERLAEMKAAGTRY